MCRYIDITHGALHAQTQKTLSPPTPTTIYLFLFENRDGRMVINKCLFIYSLSSERSTTLQQTVYIKTLITGFFCLCLEI